MYAAPFTCGPLHLLFLTRVLRLAADGSTSEASFDQHGRCSLSMSNSAYSNTPLLLKSATLFYIEGAPLVPPQCPTGWVHSTVTGSCYRLAPTSSQSRGIPTATHTDCHAQCGMMHGRAGLVCVDDADEMSWLAAQFPIAGNCGQPSNDYSGCHWIGLQKSSSGSWDQWSDGCSSAYRNWESQWYVAPRSYGSCAFWGVLGNLPEGAGRGTWDNVDCSTKMRCMCELPPLLPPSPPTLPSPPAMPPPAPRQTCTCTTFIRTHCECVNWVEDSSVDTSPAP